MLRDQAEAALKQSREHLAQVLTGSRLGLWNSDLKAGRVTVDRRYAEMLGYAVEEIPPDRSWWHDQVHPDDRERVRRLLDDHLARRSPHYEADYRMQTRQGGWRWIHSRGTVIERAADGTPLRIAGTHLDLTDRKEGEAEKNRLLDIIEASPDYIASAGLDRRYLYLNPAYRRLLGISDLAEARNLTIADAHPDWAAKIILEEAIPAVLRNGIWVGENAMRDSKGREVPVSQLIILQRDKDGKPAAHSTIARDISRQKEVEAVRLATERKILQAQKLESLGVLAGGIAHDFNNLLTAILGNASLAELDLPQDSPVQAPLQQIRKASLRAAELCKQMLAYSGRGHFNASRVDLSELVADTRQLLQVSISKKCVLTCDLARGLPTVDVDQSQIRQVLVNLVINASDAIGERSGTIRVSTGLTRRESSAPGPVHYSVELPPGDYVFLEVEDNGAGMKTEVSARIFEPFFTTKFAGRGLGLPAALGIIQGHRGAIGFQSVPGRGSRFRFLLPAAAAPEGAERDGGPAIEAQARSRGTILVVDDEETVRSVAARLLESAGFEIVLAEDGKQALEIFRKRAGDFTAVLLDLTMPHMNGEETFRELRKVRPDVPVVLMSGFSEEDSVERFAGRELAGFVPKPFDRDSLVNKLLSLVDRRDGARPAV
jgi:PAS domain S-box-containing protein